MLSTPSLLDLIEYCAMYLARVICGFYGIGDKSKLSWLPKAVPKSGFSIFTSLEGMWANPDFFCRNTQSSKAKCFGLDAGFSGQQGVCLIQVVVNQ